LIVGETVFIYFQWALHHSTGKQASLIASSF